jgi:hypothetical protein
MFESVGVAGRGAAFVLLGCRLFLVIGGGVGRLEDGKVEGVFFGQS